jgi:hypothetical protein
VVHRVMVRRTAQPADQRPGFRWVGHVDPVLGQHPVDHLGDLRPELDSGRMLVVPDRLQDRQHVVDRQLVDRHLLDDREGERLQ